MQSILDRSNIEEEVEKMCGSERENWWNGFVTRELRTPNERTHSCFARKFSAAAIVADDEDDGNDNDGDNHKSGEAKADLPKKQFGR